MRSKRYLVDASVLARERQPLIGERIAELALAGNLRTCRMIDLEFVFSAQAGEVTRVAAERRRLPEAPITPHVMDQALEIMEALAANGLHRVANPNDCVIAACARSNGLAVLHYDRDFERIAEVTGLEAEWVAPAGSLDR